MSSFSAVLLGSLVSKGRTPVQRLSNQCSLKRIRLY